MVENKTKIDFALMLATFSLSGTSWDVGSKEKESNSNMLTSSAVKKFTE